MLLSCPPPPPPPAPTPIIWVHGTKPSSIFPFLSANQQVKATVDSNTCTPKGLKRLDQLNPKGRTYALLEALSYADSQAFVREHIYSFGWSGDLNVAARRSAALRLFECIKELQAQYRIQYNSDCQVILLAHSHGGNVILSMAKELEQLNKPTITKTILLATPVQKETSHFAIHSNLFGRLYSLHSHVDLVQVLDPQRLHPYKEVFAEWPKENALETLKQAYISSSAQPFFSERHFPSCDHIIQAEICWKSIINYMPEQKKATNKIEAFFNSVTSKIINQKRGVLHTEFITTAFMQHLPSILNQLDAKVIQHGPPAGDIQIVI